jgi:hypothetical protein
MKKYNFLDQKILNPEYLLQNILQFSYEKILFVEQNNSLIDAINSEFFKDCYIYMVDNDIEIRYGEDYIDYISEYNSPYSYLVLKTEELYDKLPDHIVQILLDFITIIDTDKNKFNLFTNVYNLHSNHILILKFHEKPRNLSRFEMSENAIERLKYNVKFLQIEHYD